MLSSLITLLKRYDAVSEEPWGWQEYY